MSNTLTAGQSIKTGESIISTNKKFSLRMQQDGNLVLYKTENGKDTAIWNSKTNVPDGSTKKATIAKMQEDGNFVLYDEDRNNYWNSGTNGHNKQPFIKIQNDGNLVIYTIEDKWNSGTSGK